MQDMIIGVGTGRCGTKSIAEFLDIPHEPAPKLIKESVDYLYRIADAEELKRTLEKAIAPGGLINHRYSFLIPLVRAVHPRAKILHIVRDGKKCVASFMAREWYRHASNSAFEIHRLNGALAGVVDSEEWETSTPFEKCCFHWAYVNRHIMTVCQGMSAEQYRRINIEDFDARSLLAWAGRPVTTEEDTLVPYLNGAAHAAPSRLRTWGAKEHMLFDEIAGRVQRDLFGGAE